MTTELTGQESNDILRGNAAQTLLDDATLKAAFDGVRAYYVQKQFDAQLDVDALLRWQAHRIALEDVHAALKSYIETGEAAKARVSRWKALMQRMNRIPSRMDRFAKT